MARCSEQCRGEGHRRRLRRPEPGALGLVVGVGDGVVESTDIGHHRDRPVAHRLHLGESARFEATRYEQQVGGAVEEVGELLVVAVDEREPVRVGRRRGIQLGSDLGLARPEDDEA